MPKMWGIVPAAGRGSRIQPLAFSKELLPVGSRVHEGVERPCAVSEHLVERMIHGGVTKICFVISPGKSDIVEYFGAGYGHIPIAYMVQPKPSGLCDAIFSALPLIGPDEPVIIGLPDTVWLPQDALIQLQGDILSLLLFPVERPELFDAVITDEQGAVQEIQVKRSDAQTRWIWGALKMPGHVLMKLHALWRTRLCADEYIGTLINAYLADGGRAIGVPAGRAYVDVGTFDGYRMAMTLLAGGAEWKDQGLLVLGAPAAQAPASLRPAE